MSIVKPCVSRYTFAHDAENQIAKTSLTRGRVRSIFKEAEDSVGLLCAHLGIHLKSSTHQMKNVEFKKKHLIFPAAHISVRESLLLLPKTSNKVLLQVGFEYCKQMYLKGIYYFCCLIFHSFFGSKIYSFP
jgi:hypothetical protein